MNAVVISCASCSGELPVGTKPVVGLPLPDVTTTTTTAAAMATTTATTAAMMMFRFLFLPPPPCRACRYGPGPMTGMGEVEGSDAYHGPDDLLPPESLVTHGTVPTRQLRHKRSCYIMPGTWSPVGAMTAAGPPPWPAAALARRPPRGGTLPKAQHQHHLSRCSREARHSPTPNRDDVTLSRIQPGRCHIVPPLAGLAESGPGRQPVRRVRQPLVPGGRCGGGPGHGVGEGGLLLDRQRHLPRVRTVGGARIGAEAGRLPARAVAAV